jgi:hypothetical protein
MPVCYLTTEFDLQLPVQSVPITTKVVSWNPTHGEVYSIQQYVIKFVNDLQQVGGFLRVLRCPPPIKIDCHNIAEITMSGIPTHNFRGDRH